MRCEEARPLLAEVADASTDDLGLDADVRSHLASCRGCSAELDRYRATLVQLSALRDDSFEPPEGAVARALARVPAWRRDLLARRALSDDRMRYAAFSLAGLLVGAAAVTFLRRRARRAVAAATPTLAA